ncbi:MAG: hypothetical protein JOZ18_03845, partial [Chloroflexi bacterium]|nr:hypothetical protein [Chloroflexota bacterium]
MNSLPQQPVATSAQTSTFHGIERPGKTSPLTTTRPTPRPVRLQSMSWMEKIEDQITQTDLIAMTTSAVTAAAPKKKAKTWVSTAFRTAVTLLLFFLLAKSVSWPTLITTLISVHHTYLLVGLGLGLLGVGLSAYVWRVLLVGEGIH